MQEART